MTDYDHLINKKSHSIIYEDIVDRFFKIFVENELYYETDVSYFTPISKLVMASYILDSQKVKITVDDYLHYYNDELVFRLVIKNKKDLYNILNEMIYEVFAYRDAENLGITTAPKFKMDELNYKNSVVMQFYEEQELLTKSPVTDNDINDSYEKNKNRFIIPEYIISNMFFFNSWNDAQKARTDIKNSKDDNSNDLPKDLTRNLCNMIFNKEISYKDSLFSKKIIDNLYKIQKGNIAGPYKIDGKYVMFKKVGEKGKIVMPLEDVKKQIIYIAEQDKIQQVKKETLPELKKKYQLVDLIDHHKYIQMAQDSTSVLYKQESEISSSK